MPSPKPSRTRPRNIRPTSKSRACRRRCVRRVRRIARTLIAPAQAKRFRAQLEGANRELARAHAELDALEQQRTDAERGAASARETARQARAALEAQRAREAGLLEGRRIGLEEGMRGYLRESGGLPPASPRANAESARAAFQRGRARGYEEGRLAGAQTGASPCARRVPLPRLTLASCRATEGRRGVRPLPRRS